MAVDTTPSFKHIGLSALRGNRRRSLTHNAVRRQALEPLAFRENNTAAPPSSKPPALPCHEDPMSSRLWSNGSRSFFLALRRELHFARNALWSSITREIEINAVVPSQVQHFLALVQPTTHTSSG
ncbi:hypothetical protein PHYPSEUDO_006383 [Phytophthora pseudosyringae]|uniref:Uncharacterized protein n=1 Tax=Phytophthora pseudosyringae TaxID=221518 RepID=A0A8T1WGX8_9STRA|nr:hypothetical protein PHYPSEUDO_006383 [Phytophthora pseudosyringae]